MPSQEGAYNVKITYKEKLSPDQLVNRQRNVKSMKPVKKNMIK